jgi:hypothetical protein
MKELTLFLVFFSSLVAIFGLGISIGKIFGLEKYLDKIQSKPHAIK